MRSKNYQDSLVDLTGTEIKKENNGKKKCRWENCLTRLNTYNPNKYCHAHVSKGVWKETLRRDEELKAIAKKNITPWKVRMEKKRSQMV